MHLVRRAREYTLEAPPAYAGHSDGYTVASLIDETSGSVHTGLSLNALAPGGYLSPHIHSYEEGFYILAGDIVGQIGGEVWQLGPGDYGVCKVGTLHSWRGTSAAPARWLQMAAPQPKAPGRGRDTFFLKDGLAPERGVLLSEADRGVEHVAHFGIQQIPGGDEGRDVIGGLKGVFLKWLIDDGFGARHHRLALIEYQPDVSIALHDHTFEEAYFILSGDVEATLDGQQYRAGPGDVLWTGVGCVHAFANRGPEPVRWLETFSPQPPAENVFRFMAEWAARGAVLEAGS